MSEVLNIPSLDGLSVQVTKDSISMQMALIGDKDVTKIITISREDINELADQYRLDHNLGKITRTERIKAIWELTGFGLKQSKDIAEAMFEEPLFRFDFARMHPTESEKTAKFSIVAKTELGARHQMGAFGMYPEFWVLMGTTKIN